MMRHTVDEHTVCAVLDAIPCGRQNAIARRKLADLTRLTDRTVRAAIEEARRNGEMIISAPNGGYYLSTDVEDVKAQYRVDRARALSVLARLKPMRKYLKEKGERV